MKTSLKLALLLLSAAPALARAQALSPGFELERTGRYADAANVYLTIVRADPINSLALRTYAALNEGDSLEAAALRWAASAPLSDAPYREWGLALVDHRMWDDARRAYLTGRQPLGGEGTLAIELAELEQRAGNWEASAREWARAVMRSPDAAPNAASQLSESPAPLHERIVRALTGPEARPRVRRIAAELLLTWGQPAQAWSVFEPTLSDSDAQGSLRRFADLAGTLTTPEAHRVRGLALTRWADLVPWPLAARARAEAVRELLEAGDRVAARHVLEGLATDSTAPTDAHSVAQSALLQVLIADGGVQLDVAEKQLADPNTRLSADDRAALRLALARARIARGELDRATAALGDDSSVTAVAQRGWIALYRGDLKGAMESFRLAGPYATDRAAATDRTGMMALLQRVQEESSPELGAALLTLARGDSTNAVAGLRRAAARLPEQGGRLEVLLLAGQVAAQKGGEQEVTAVALFEEIVRAGVEGGGAAPPAAELDWARLLVRAGRSGEAIPHLEHLILTYPSSAVVPEARRELERAKGAIPKS